MEDKKLVLNSLKKVLVPLSYTKCTCAKGYFKISKVCSCEVSPSSENLSHEIIIGKIRASLDMIQINLFYVGHEYYKIVKCIY